MNTPFWHGFLKGIAIGVLLHIAFLVVMLTQFFDAPLLPVFVIGLVASGLWGIYAENQLDDGESGGGG